MSYTEADLQKFLANPAVKIAGNSCHKPATVKENLTVEPPPARGTPNKTEAEYGRMLEMEFPGAIILFEGLRLPMSNGHSYRPDWFVWDGNMILCVEIKAVGKNGYKHPSYQRARLAYDQCRVEWPSFRWRWAEKSKGIWEIRKDK